jgi:hypothetical protein
VQALLQQLRLKIAKALPLADVIERELGSFTVRITPTLNETFAADTREGEHEDLVLAVALAAWVGENCLVGPWTPSVADRSNRSILCSAPSGLFGGLLDRDDDDEEDGPRGW